MDKIIAAAEVAAQEEKTSTHVEQNTAPTAEAETEQPKPQTEAAPKEKKVSLISIGVPPTFEPQTVQIGEATIQIKTRLPYETLFEMIDWCIKLIVQDRPYVSEPLKVIISDFAVLKYYTNFEIDEPLAAPTAKEIYEFYDLVKSYNIVDKIKTYIDAQQLDFFNYSLTETLKSVVAYKNSVYGVIEEIAKNAETLTKNMEQSLDMVQGKNENAEMINKIIKTAEVLK